MKLCLKLRATLSLTLCLSPFSTFGLAESDQVYDSFPHSFVSAPLALDDHYDEYDESVEDARAQRTHEEEEEEAAMIAKESGLMARYLCEETDNEYSSLMTIIMNVWEMLWSS